jgi:hypothetical protein
MGNVEETCTLTNSFMLLLNPVKLDRELPAPKVYYPRSAILLVDWKKRCSFQTRHTLTSIPRLLELLSIPGYAKRTA